MRTFKLFLILILSSLIFGCNDTDKPKPPTTIKVDHTLFIYLANLPSYIMESNIDSMLVGLNATKPDGRVVIFYDNGSDNTELVDLKQTSSGVYERVVLKDYGEILNPSDVNTFKLALKDLQELAPCKSYSMIFSSHGSAWVSGDMISKNRPRSLYQELIFTPNLLTRAIVDDRALGDGIDIHDITDAIPDGMFDVILFDACNMGCIEVIYPLRNKADFIIASPSEVLIEGFPYVKIMGNLFDKSDTKRALTEVCEDFFEHYDNYIDSRGHMAGCNIAMYDCSKIESVAKAFSAIVDETFYTAEIPSTDGLQWFDGPINPHLTYDMQEFAETWAGETSALAMMLNTSLNGMIVYAQSSQTSHPAYNLFKSPVTAFSGVCIYVPQKLTLTNQYYMTTDWYKRVYGDKVLFEN